MYKSSIFNGLLDFCLLKYTDIYLRLLTNY